MKIDYLKDDNNTVLDGEKKVMPKRILVSSKSKTMNNVDELSDDILVVASKLKKYIKEKHGLSTSAEVMARLSDILRVTSDRACERAKQEGRKTLMERDF